MTASDAESGRLVRHALREWPLVVACAVVASLAGYVASASKTQQFESTTTIQLGEADLSSLLLGQQNFSDNAQNAERDAKTNAELITLPTVRELTAKALGGGLSPAALKAAITVQSTPDSNLIGITARSADPKRAAEIANATTEAFIETRRRATQARVDQAKKQVQAQIATLGPGSSQTASLLNERLRQVDVLGAVGNGVDVVQPARLPTAAVAPEPRRSAILALILGGMFGTAVALLRARMDDHIREPEQFRELWDLPLIGTIPNSRELPDLGRGLPSGAVLEAFALARTNLRYLHVGGEVKTVIVTSSVAEEGKSTVTWNLALASALAEAKVLVIEADLRRPGLSARLALKGKNGLAEVLAGLADLDEAIVAVDVGVPERGLAGTVDVLPAGLVPPSPIALLERERLAEVLTILRPRYDLILIDTPPTTVVADTLIVAPQADGVLIVSRIGQSRRASFQRLRDQFVGAATPVLGQVVNGTSTASSYEYGSYYGSTSDAPVAATAPSS